MLVLLSLALAYDVVDTDPDGDVERLRVTLGGFVQPRFTWTVADDAVGSGGELGFSVRRMRVEQGGSVRLGPSEVGWKLSTELMPEARLQDAVVLLSRGPVLLQVGQFKAPTSRTLLASDRHTLLPERAELEGLTPGREMGVMLGYEQRWFAVQGGVFDGEGRNRLGNVNRKFLYAWRAVLSPIGAPSTGKELLAVGAEPVLNLGYTGHLNVLGPEGSEEASVAHGAELLGHWRWVTLQGEFLWGFTDFQNVDVPDFTQLAWYGQLGAFVPGTPWTLEHLALLARYEEVDPFIPVKDEVPLVGPADLAQHRRNVDLGVGLYVGERWPGAFDDARVVATWRFARELEGSPYDNDTLLVSGHLSF